MDAYSEMVMRLSNARLADLCREAERDRLAGSLVGRRIRRRKPVSEVSEVAPVTAVADVAVLATAPPADQPLRRSA